LVTTMPRVRDELPATQSGGVRRGFVATSRLSGRAGGHCHRGEARRAGAKFAHGLERRPARAFYGIAGSRAGSGVVFAKSSWSREKRLNISSRTLVAPVPKTARFREASASLRAQIGHGWRAIDTARAEPYSISVGEMDFGPIYYSPLYYLMAHKLGAVGT